jgi:hypothetical protein
LIEARAKDIVRALRWASDLLQTSTVAVVEHVDSPFRKRDTNNRCLPRFSVFEEVMEADSVDVDLNVSPKTLEFLAHPAEAFA